MTPKSKADAIDNLITAKIQYHANPDAELYGIYELRKKQLEEVL